MKKKKLLQDILCVVFLLAAIVVLFRWYTTQNSRRMEERNKNYAADSARLKAEQLDEELSDALNRINVHAYFLGESLDEPVVTAEMLKEMEKNTLFDALMFTDRSGKDYASDGRTADVTAREFYQKGIKGQSGISIIFDPHFFDETMASFYAPVHYKDKVIGVLRGAYLAEEYLKEMLTTTYFGEKADVYLCTKSGIVIASSKESRYDKHLLDVMTESRVIDKDTADSAKKILKAGGKVPFSAVRNVKRIISASCICRKMNLSWCRHFLKM